MIKLGATILILVLSGCGNLNSTEVPDAKSLPDNGNEQQGEILKEPKENEQVGEHSMPPVSEVPLLIQQNDGTSIHVKGLGNMHVSYTETIDGYTIVRNENDVYEYAFTTTGGDLIPGGVKVNDPENREVQENEYLTTTPLHLRYTSSKLIELKKKRNEFYEPNKR